MKWIAVIILIAILGIVGAGDFQDELDEERRYIEFVCDKTWPDYKDIKPECK